MRWKILAIVFLARSGLGVQFQTLGSTGVVIQAKLNINLGEFGLLVGLFMLAGIFLSFPAGLLNRYATDRLILVSGLLLLALGGLVGTLQEAYSFLAVGRIISGIGFVLGTLYFAKLVSDWFDGRELATAMGILVMSWPLGIAVAQVSVPWLATNFGWQSAFYGSSAWCLLGALAIAWILPSREITGPPKNTDFSGKSVFTPRHWKLTALAAVAWGSFNAGFIVYLTFIDARLTEVGFSTAKSVLYGSLPSWIMPLAAIVVGQWVDRTGARHLAIAVASFTAVVALLLLAYTPWSLLGVLLFGVLGASAAGVIMALTVQAMPVGVRAFGMGVFFTIYFICVLLAPAIAGRLGDVTGGASSALALGALLFAITGVSSLLFKMSHALVATEK